MTAVPLEAGPGPSSLAPRRRLRFTVFLRASWLNNFGIAIVVAVLFAAAFGGIVRPYDPSRANFGAILQPPSWSHPFGTDDLGRDLLSRVLVGAHYSVEVAAIVLAISVTLGSLLGVFAATLGGIVDEVVMRITDLFLAFPALVFAAAIAGVLGPSLNHTMIALATVYWPWYARLARGQVLELRERDFVAAAYALGAGYGRIVFRHLVPNIFPVIIVQMSMDAGYAMLSTASLGFLGLGAQPPQPEWGAILLQSTSYVLTAWWYAVLPGLVLTVTVLGFNLLGDGLREWLDPRLRSVLCGA